MSKDSKYQDDPDYDDLDAEITREEVSRIIKKHPHDYVEKLEDIGFVFYDDDVDHEELEEANAKPVNANQEYLISFFDGDIPLSEQTVEVFLEERRSLEPNFPLIRKFFRQANKQLLSMLLRGLQQHPVSAELLSDLAYFHEHQNILKVLVDQYTIACEKEQDMVAFSELAMDFYYATHPDGYDALYALKEVYPVGSSKRKVVDFLMEIERRREKRGEDIKF